MKNRKLQNKYKKSNRYGKYQNIEDIDKIFRTSESTASQSNKNKPSFSIIAYIKNIIKSIFFKNNINKHTTDNPVINNPEYFLSSQNSSLDETISTPSLQVNATKLAQDNNINKDNATNASLTFSTFDKEIKNSNQDTVKDNRRRSSSPPPPIRTSSLNKTSLAQDNNTNKDNTTNASLTFSTFGKEIKNSNQDTVKDNRRRSSSPPPPVRTSSLSKGKGKNGNIRR